MGLRGQCICSNRTIEKDLGIYESVVKRFLGVRQIVQILHKHLKQIGILAYLGLVIQTASLLHKNTDTAKHERNQQIINLVTLLSFTE
jgi:hypothetical protein